MKHLAVTISSFLALSVRAAGPITIENDGRDLVIKAGGKPVLGYNITIDQSQDPKQPLYRRSGYIHPIHDPAGRIVTDDFPPDHMHQHGLFFAWTKCKFDGQPVDFWNQAGGNGTVLHDKLRSTFTDGYSTTLQHLALGRGVEPIVVLRETWTVRVVTANDDYRAFDIESVQTCGTDKPLVIEKYHYGGMALRGARQWFHPADPKSADILTSEGKNRKEGTGTRCRWVAMYGEIDGKSSGIAVLCHPSNFRFPQPVRLHGDKPYFCWSPQVLGEFSIEPGKPYVSRYRYIMHMGKPDPALLDRLWNDYAKAPIETPQASPSR
jgi:hypothetical protein